MICRGLMKSTLLFVAMVAIASRADTQSREEAEIYGARAGICVSVVDDDNMVVSNAEVEVYFGMAVREGKTVRGVSDKTGNFAADGKTTGEVYVNVRKIGE